jgi:hypothetical protein
MRFAVFITCNNRYVPLAIVALKCFTRRNIDYDMYILGTKFETEMYDLSKNNNIILKEVDLQNDFKVSSDNIYPVECFYHFYAYKILEDYDYIVNIEPDIYTNKRLDVDFKKISYIAGTFRPGVKISTFTPIMNDINIIKEVYDCDIDQDRILGGFRIYNVNNLKIINFYDKIVDYYKNSLRLGVPRKGDDSLMVLYQMTNKTHIRLLSPEYHVVFRNISEVEKIYHFHFTGASCKYWENHNITNETELYFKNKFIEFVYNNFELSFIKKYIPSIYIDIESCLPVFYYYNYVDNFGDMLTPYFLKKVCKNGDYSFDFEDNTNHIKILGCGSIMSKFDKNNIVYGSGIRNIDQNIKNNGIIKCVRGPLTRKRLMELNCYCPPEYGDLGLLLPFYYSPRISKKYVLGIIPHHTQYYIVKNLYTEDNVIVIDLKTQNVEHVIDLILSCDNIISSSLHGLIVSDAYNIPNKWVIFDNNFIGDNTKFHDYFLSVDRKDTEYIDGLRYKKIGIYDIISQIKHVDIKFDIEKLQENMFFDKNGVNNYAKYLISKLC